MEPVVHKASASERRLDVSGTAGSVWGIIVAAGTGERLGLDRPKAFAPLGGRPLLAESIDRLDRCPWVDALVIVSAAGWEEPAILLAEEIVATKVVSCVTGGTTRAESVRAGLQEVVDDALVILVHDAARPLVSNAVVERVLGPLGEGYDGVVPVVPVQDTLKRVAGAAVVETVSRTDLVAAQTPQAFLAPALRRGLAGDLTDATDCASLVERTGGRIAAVDGDPWLMKVTTKADLALLEAILAGEG
ncbi:MAG: 2-C-methyl-D-erythritol 4-phosphate cytidylyltransferase [Actinobacteria bacterium]|nr:2-C-methyl-D-erythritol 4-phosphate cytidylyltransferase [Actinomycetota bacterium]